MYLIIIAHGGQLSKGTRESSFSSTILNALGKFCVQRTSDKGGSGIIIEHPVSRAKGSPFAIPGRELHSTM